MVGASKRVYHGAVSTHSRPKAAGWQATTPKRTRPSFNTQPPEGGWFISFLTFVALKTFQHTAARRRLDTATAGFSSSESCFNTQQPERGWTRITSPHCIQQ